MNIETLDAQWGECWLEPVPVPPDLAADVRKALGGNLPSWTPLMARVPWVVRAMLGGIEKKVAHMPIDLWDLISFVVSQDNACRYCYGATRGVLRVLGYSDATIDRLEENVDLADIPAAEQAAMRFARKLSRYHPKPGAADLAELEAAGFSRQAVAEIVFASAFAGFGNRMATLFALRPDSTMEHLMEKPLMRLIRPWIARQFRGRRLPAAALPAPNEPPFEDLIARLDGTPLAHSLRTGIDVALASPILPRRTKLLMVAVIARTLDSTYIAAQVAQALEAEGISRETLASILDRLGGPELSAAETHLVPFARETVWYRTPDLQQRARELRAHLSTEEMIEAAGVTSLGNGIARLSLLIEAC
jgi:AhpD family alkylhydroperoxidase